MTFNKPKGIFREYSDDEPRDDHGKWSSGMTYYHAGAGKLTQAGVKQGLSLTDTRQHALGYLQKRGGFLHSFAVSSAARIANEAHLFHLRDKLGLNPGDHSYAFEIADEKKVRDALIADGYHAVRYQDMSPDNRYQHDTLLMLDSSCVKLTKVEPHVPK